MQIETVKELKNGYLVNNCLLVPKDPRNSDFRKVQKHISSGKVYETYDSLADLKTEKLSQLKSRRENSTIQEVKKGKTFSLKSSDMPAIIARFNRTQGGEVLTANWTDITGARIALNAEDFRSMRNHLDTQDETINNEYERIKKLIEASTTIHQLNAIQFTF